MFLSEWKKFKTQYILNETVSEVVLTESTVIQRRISFHVTEC